MNKKQIKQNILHNQHITNKTSCEQVVKDMCGLQAQFFNNPKFALQMRSFDYDENTWNEKLVKTWTLRGTLHTIHQDDFSMFMAFHSLPSWFETYHSDVGYDAIEKLIWKYLDDEVKISRKQLGVLMKESDFDEHSISIATNAWGGVFMKLCHNGEMVFSGVCERDFKRSEGFSEMCEKEAKKQLMSRYFKNYGPATLNDAAYFTKFKKSELKDIINQLHLKQCCVDDRVYYYYEVEGVKAIPEVLMLGAFDPLLLGYEKKESLFLKKEHIRGIFNLTGIVFAPILYKGDIVGRWKLNKKVMECSLFEQLTKKQLDAIEKYCMKNFTTCETVEFTQFTF